MPKFTISTDDGGGSKRCGKPVDFTTERAATDVAQIALAEMAKDYLPDGKTAHFGVEVNDASGKGVYRADLRFSAKDGDDIVRENQEADEAASVVAEHLRGGPRNWPQK